MLLILKKKCLKEWLTILKYVQVIRQNETQINISVNIMDLDHIIRNNVKKFTQNIDNSIRSADTGKLSSSVYVM